MRHIPIVRRHRKDRRSPQHVKGLETRATKQRAAIRATTAILRAELGLDG